MIPVPSDLDLPPAEPVTDIVEQLKRLLVDQAVLELRLEEIDADASILEEGLGLDSIMLVEFIALLEAEFGFTFAESELTMDVFASLRALAEFIARRRSLAA